MTTYESLGEYLNTKCAYITSDPDNGRIDVRKLMGALKFLCSEIDQLKSTNKSDAEK